MKNFRKSDKLSGGKIRAAVCALFIFGLTVMVSAQRAENEIIASPEASDSTYINVNPITINDNAVASPYPSNIVVNNPGLTTVTKVQVKLYNFTHTYPDDVDIVLVGPGGQRAMVMSDAGGSTPVNNLNLTFDSTSANILPENTVLSSGTTRPANYELGVDNFPFPGPGALTNESADLSVFNLTNPNGTWSLYVVDDAGGDVGQIGAGWDLILTVPTVFTVNSTADTTDGVCNAANCTLREAITAAQNNDLINFSTLFNTPQTINLLTALPDINQSVTIQGTGANLLTVRRAFNAATDFRIFNIPGGVTNGVAISGMTITGGNAGSGIFGGGILSTSNLTLTNVHVTGNTAESGGGVALVSADGTFTNCTFSNNSSTNPAGSGGGINFQGFGGRTLRVVSSTVSGNSAVNRGGGIFNLNASNGNSRLEIVNSTIANNTANNGGGIDTFTQSDPNSTATTTLRNSIVAGNSPNNLATGTVGGGAATFQTLGFNLSDNFNGVFTPNPLPTDITGQPRLAPLANYGGQTPTHALLGGSAAIDKGDDSDSTFDQRGQPRVFDTGGIFNALDGADIGAVEMRTIFVTNANNDGAGSLRQAIAAANSLFDHNDIIFDTGFFNTTPRTITLTTGEFVINSNLTIIGAGANLLTVSGNNQSRVININSGFTASLSGMTITGGNGVGTLFSGEGGGIFNRGNLTVTHSAVSGNTTSGYGGGISNGTGRLTVTSSTISGNTANNSGGGGGGGIDNSGGLTVTNSTVSGNSVPNSNNNGGGIWTQTGIATITNSTIANNSAAGAGSAGGVFRNSGTVLIRNCIVAGNVNNSTVPDVFALGNTGITSNGFNLIGNRGALTVFNQPGDQSGTNLSPLDPLLAPLRYYGSATPTHGLYDGSPALDKGQSSGFLTDQRGFRRPFDFPGITNPAGGDGADIGAFEGQTSPTAATVSIGGQIFTPENRGLRNAVVTLTDQSGNVRAVTTAAFGFYEFTDVAAGETYIISVQSKRYRFATQVVSVSEAIDNLNFTAER